MDDERGAIKRVSFEILYPTGQLKQVHVAIGGVPKWEGAGLVVWSESVLREVVLPGLEARYGAEAATDALKKWEEVDGQFKPAMLIVKEEGETIQMCGNHAKLGHAALWDDGTE